MTTTILKKRTELPNFKKVSHVKVDIDRLLKCFENFSHLQDNISETCGSPYLSDKYKQTPITQLKEDLKYYRNNKEDERCYGRILSEYKDTYVEEVINMFKSPVTRCRLVVKEPGATILPHIDYDTTYSIRVYISLKTNPWAMTAVKSKKDKFPEVRHLPADGSAWFVNPGSLHSAWNFGETDDVRMILSINGQKDLQ